MNVLMLNEARAIFKGLPALLALVGFLAGVDSSVKKEAFWPEGFSAFVVFIGLGPRMDFLTKSEGCLGAERGRFFRTEDHWTLMFIRTPLLAVTPAPALPVVVETRALETVTPEAFRSLRPGCLCFTNGLLWR